MITFFAAWGLLLTGFVLGMVCTVIYISVQARLVRERQEKQQQDFLRGMQEAVSKVVASRPQSMGN